MVDYDEYESLNVDTFNGTNKTLRGMWVMGEVRKIWEPGTQGM